MPQVLGPHVAGEVGGAIGVAVGVAVEAGHPQRRLRRAAVIGQVELLLRKRDHQEPQPVELLRVEDAVEEPVVVLVGDQLALRHIAQIGPRRQEDGRGELRQEVVGQVELEVKAGQVALGLLQDLLDVELRKDHATFGVVGVREREEPLGKEPLIPNLGGLHVGELLPRRLAR